jgi:diadenosine tetraphosphatase ApaH/serine/threonine PP2A family protein phosphatase
VALSFVRPEGEPATGSARRGGEEADLSEGEWILNPGSVGQPRDGDARAAWLLLDTTAWTASWRRVEYDIAGAAASIRAARLPDSLAERLEYGQ